MRSVCRLAPRRNHGRVTACIATLVLVMGACTDQPVDWALPSGGAMPATGAPLAVTATGAVVADTMEQLAQRVTPPGTPLCAGSLRLARAGSTLHAVWWSPRPDSGARLLSARSSDGGHTWSPASTVDTLDRGVNGCRRAPAAVAADSASGYVHVAYGLEAPEGPGLFFAHSMDGGATFHSPVPIFYGERLGRTSVAADGDLVIVGFEDPNSATPRVGLAISGTMGHIFEHRLLPVSDDNGAASHPMTAVRGRHIVVAWEQRAANRAPSGTPALVVRAGLLH